MDNNFNIIEGLLFLAGDDGINNKLVAQILEISKAEATKLLDEFSEQYDKKPFNGITLVNYGGNYKLASNPEYFEFYRKMVQQSEAKLSNAALETLAIIAYNSPITRTDIEEIRGVGCDAMIRKLSAKALIKEVGRQDTPGLPILYGVTDEFMDAFGLVSLDELPPLKDIVEIEDDQDIFETRYQEEVSDETN